MNRMFRNILMTVPAVLLAVWACSRVEPLEEPFIETSSNEDIVDFINPYWDWSDKFPGVVSSAIERENDVEVTVAGGYAPLAFAPDSMVIQSTGLYAPGCETVTIIVPEGVSGLKYQIGQGYALAEGQLRLRYGDVVKRGTLHPGENNVLSYFGGYLYFGYEPEDVPAGDITVSVSGAVRSDDFIYGETNSAEWVARMSERANLLAAPSENVDSMAFLHWTELRSDRVILTLGLPELNSLRTSPSEILKLYTTAIETYYEWAGLDITNQPPFRICTDIQLPDPSQTPLFASANEYAYGSYPLCYRRGENATTFAMETRILNPYYIMGLSDPADASTWPELHYALTKAFNTALVDCEMFRYVVSKLGLMYYTYKIYGVRPTANTIDFDGIVKSVNTTYNMYDNPESFTLPMFSWPGYAATDIRDKHRTTCAKQLLNEYGFGLLPYLNQRAKELGFVYYDDPYIQHQSAFDFFAMTASEYADRDLTPFFMKWYYPLTPFAKDYMHNFAPIDEETAFWKTYDNELIPSYEPRTPNKSFERPDWKRYGEILDPSLQDYWYLKGILYNINNDSKVRSGNSIISYDDNSPVRYWRNAIDGDPNNEVYLLNEIQLVTNQAGSHRPWFELSFVGPGEEKPASDLTEYPDDSLSFNTLFFVNGRNKYRVTYIYDIQYLDGETGEWKPTSPSEFRTLFETDYRPFFFDKTYTTKKVRFYLYGASPGNSGLTKLNVSEITFGNVNIGDIPEPEPEPEPAPELGE